MKTPQFITRFGLIAGLVTLIACGSGATGSDSTSTTRSVSGNLPAATASTSVLARSASDSCAADSVMALDTAGNATSANVANDCSFSMDLTIGKTYLISFLLGDNFIAALIFDSGFSGFSTSMMPITDSPDGISLGTITFNGNTAFPENNPLEDCDSDDDGESDFDDDDDDDDGVSDDSEDDCDYDGTFDDYDDSSCNDSSHDGEYILRIKPYDGSDEVDLDKDVKIYTTCPVDLETVSTDTFMVESEFGDAIECEYDVSDDDDNVVKCRHDDNPFEANTAYTVTIDGITCMDGTPLENISWDFTTESEDNDDGCSEDDYDDEFEIEDEGDSEDGGDDEGDDEDEDEGDDEGDDE